MSSTVLIVDDNSVLRTLLILQLRKLGVQSDAASDGVEAIQCFKKHRNYRLVLMDVMMPNMDGLEATTEIRDFELAENLVRVPIIGVTASDNKAACLATGMDDYYLKPLMPDQILAIIEKWMPDPDKAIF